MAHRADKLIKHLGTYKSNLEAAEQSQKVAVAAAIDVDVERHSGNMERVSVIAVHALGRSQRACMKVGCRKKPTSGSMGTRASSRVPEGHTSTMA